MTLPTLPTQLEPTRDELRRVATHILARARHDATGRFGLRARSGAIATPAFGETIRVLRLTPTALIVEAQRDDGARSQATTLDGATLDDLAEMAGVDLSAEFSAGHDTPPVGDSAAALNLDSDVARTLFAWFGLGAEVLDRIVATATEPAVVQLWPEHFDLAVDVAAGPSRVNLGVSPGDGGHDAPYLYVGPWESDRPGDPDFWNAPFGATLDYKSVADAPDPAGTAEAFFRRGVELLG